MFVCQYVCVVEGVVGIRGAQCMNDAVIVADSVSEADSFYQAECKMDSNYCDNSYFSVFVYRNVIEQSVGRLVRSCVTGVSKKAVLAQYASADVFMYEEGAAERMSKRSHGVKGGVWMLVGCNR